MLTYLILVVFATLLLLTVTFLVRRDRKGRDAASRALARALVLLTHDDPRCTQNRETVSPRSNVKSVG